MKNFNMENYKKASKVDQEIILTYLKKRMKEKKITQQQLSEVLKVGRTTIIRYFKMETQMPLGVYLEICDALKLRPYLIPDEDDKTEIKRMFFIRCS